MGGGLRETLIVDSAGGRGFWVRLVVSMNLLFGRLGRGGIVVDVEVDVGGGRGFGH